MPSTGEYFELRAGEYANIYAHHGFTLRALYFRIKWYPLHQTRRTVLAEIGSVAGLQILDLGCGAGGYAIEFARRGARVTAVDASPSMLAHGRRGASEAGVGERIAFVNADGLDYLVDGRTPFDVTVAIGVFDYVTDPQAWLTQVARRARRLIATFPRRSAFQSMIDWHYRQIGLSARVYDQDQLGSWLTAAGYDDVRVITLALGGYLVIASQP